MLCRALALASLTLLASCQRPPKPPEVKPAEFQSLSGSSAELRLAPPNPVLSASAPVVVKSTGLPEQLPQQVEFSIDLSKLESAAPILLEEMEKPHQFGKTSSLTFKSDKVESPKPQELLISGNWYFDGQSKPASIPASWSLDGSRINLDMTPAFRLRDFRPLPKDAPKQTIDPRFQLRIQATLAPVS